MRCIAVVDLPEPPFSLPITITCAGPVMASRRLQPDGGVVEHRAAIGEPGIGADQRVDAELLLEIAVRPDPLDHHDAGLQPVEDFDLYDDRGLVVANPDPPAFAEPERLAV